ncbi:MULTISPECIES: hypothetical protein [unclassified Streptomyces]
MPPRSDSQPDPRKVGQNPTGRERRSSAGSRRLADKKAKAAEADKRRTG